MIGPWSSGVALAVSEVAKRKKVLHLFSGGTEDISGSRCHRYSFQWAASPYTAAKTVVDNFMKANPKAKRWHLLVADYAFGWSVEKYIKEVGKTHGLEFVGADRHPLGEREFSNYVQKAAANRPDVSGMINFGGDAVAGAREIFNFGLTPKVPLIMTWSSGVEELVQLSPEIRENLWVGSNFYYTADTPVAKEFVKNYQAKFGTPPGYAPSAAYSMTRTAAGRLRQGQVRRGAGRGQGAGGHRGGRHRRADAGGRGDAPDAAAVFLHALQAEGGDEARDRLRRHHCHRRRAAAQGIRRLQGHRRLLSCEFNRRTDP